MSEQLTELPATFTAGDTLNLLVSLSDYPASAGNVLKYALRCYGKTNIDLVSTASGNSHLIQVPSASSVGPPAVVGTSAWTAGDYDVIAYVVNGSNRDTIERTRITILPDPVATLSTTDTRSHARKVLDAIQAVLEGTASKDQQEMQIDGERIVRRSIDDLLKLRSTYATIVANEEAKTVAGGVNSGPFPSISFGFGARP